jgi:cephalosporin hydroxylase
MPSALTRFAQSSLGKRLRPWIEDGVVRQVALTVLIKRTVNFGRVTWLGKPIWQNVTDAWLLQESLVDGDVDFVVECGTNRGGSAYYMATIFDLLGRGKVLTIDVEKLSTIEHPRVEFLTGSSTDPAIVEVVRNRIAASNPNHVLVILDSDHSERHVAREMDLYAEFVKVGDYMHVQDGCIDQLWIFRRSRPGPLRAIEHFLSKDNRFVVDQERSKRYLVGHSPKGWLRRVR